MTKQIKIPEVWRPIDGFPSYEVSDQGNVRRWYDMTERRAELRAKNPDWPEWYTDVFAIKLRINATRGTVRMEKVRDSGKYYERVVTRLVLAAFPDLESVKTAA